MTGQTPNPTPEGILDSGDFQRFIGQLESQSLEVKRFEAYDLDDVGKRFELIKDVSAMANGGGGLLIVGLSERENETGPDVITGLDLAPADRLPAHRVQSVVRDNTRPPLAIVAEWVESEESPGMGVVAVRVPPFNPAAGKHFLLQLVDAGRPLKSIFFGLFEREASGTRVMTAEKAERMLRSGTSETARRLEALESQTAQVLATLTAVQESVGTLAVRLDELRDTPKAQPPPDRLNKAIHDILDS